MIKNNKIALLIPDGVGVKNYVYSGVFDDCDSDITVLHEFSRETYSKIKSEKHNFKDCKLPIYKETKKEKFLRELIHLCRLKINAEIDGNPTILSNWSPKTNKFSQYLFYNLITLFSFFCNSYKTILWIENRYQRIIRKNTFYFEIKDYLAKEGFDILFCTHQRALNAPLLFAAAFDLKIKTITVIFSWDNLPKARLGFRADEYFVWSSYMKNEFLKYYPEVDPKSIIVTGTPQFEFFLNEENILPKQDFFDKYGLDSSKNIICFSGDDSKTSPNDPEYLFDLLEAIKNGNLEKEYQILFRRCPVDISNRYQWVIDAGKGIIKEAAPLWNLPTNTNEWAAVFPLEEDIKLLVSTCFYSDVVVNVGSTMAFEFALFNKPCIYINYDQPRSENWSVETVYNFQHFKSMSSKKAVYWLNSKDAIIDLVKKATESGCSEEMKQWSDTIIGDYENASKNIQKRLISQKT